VQQRGYGIVERTAVARVDEVEHSQTVLLAIVKADGAAVAVPDGVARSVKETQAVMAQVHTFERFMHQDSVALLFNTHPGFGSAFLDTVHQSEKHHAKVRRGVHYRHVGA
jgi:light-regulated signal transduction histidine kinase (bacteriophytochrome)